MPVTYVERIARFSFTLVACGLLLIATVRSLPPDAAGQVAAHTGADLPALVQSAVRDCYMLFGLGVALALPLALLAGVPAARRPGSRWDRLLQGPLLVVAAVPPFLLALVVFTQVTMVHHWVSANGAALTALALGVWPWLARAVRDGMVHVVHPSLAPVAVIGQVGRQAPNILLVALTAGNFAIPSRGAFPLLEVALRFGDRVAVYALLAAGLLPLLAACFLGDLLATAATQPKERPARPSAAWVAAGAGLTALLVVAAFVSFGDVTAKFTAYLTPSGAHWLGTDRAGHDQLAVLSLAVRQSLLLAGGAAGIAAAGGLLLGGLGFVTGELGAALLTPRTTSPALLGPFLAAVVAVAVLGPGMWTMAAAMGVALVPGVAYHVRRWAACEAGPWPAVGALLLAAAQALLTETAIATLGFPAASPTLGTLARAALFLRDAPHLLISPLVGVAGTAGLFLLGHALLETVPEPPAVQEPVDEVPA